MKKSEAVWCLTHRRVTFIEGHLLDVPDAQDQRAGTLLGLYRHIGENLKIGVSYNFTDFSDRS